jgi:RNA ligase (TIGR02306 family)
VTASEKTHGSCAVASLDLDADRLFVSSKGFAARNQAIKEDAANLYWRALRVHDIEAKMRAIAERLGVRRLGLFGEVYGAGVQDLTYGVASRNEPGYAAFDAAVVDESGRTAWLDQATLRSLCAEVGIAVMPEIYAGPYDYDALAALAEGPTVVGNGAHIREGIVVRPQIERADPITGGRAIAKFVSAAYLTRRGETTEFE